MRIPLKRYLALLVTYLKPQWHRTLLMAVFLLCSVGLRLLSPLILRTFIDTIATGGAVSTLVVAAVSFILVALLSQGVSIATTYFSENIAWTATNQLRSDLVAHCLSLDMSFHKARTSGELIERIDGDVDALSNFFSQFVVSLLGSLLLLLSMLILLYGIDWRVGLAMTLLACVTLFILMRLRLRVVPIWVALRQMSATFFGFLGEHLGGTEDVRANGATGYVMRRFYQMQQRWFPIYRKARLASNGMWIITLTMFIIGAALNLALGTYLWSRGIITIGTVYLIFSYTDMLSQPIRDIQTQLQDLQQAEACIKRVEELLHTESALPEGHGGSLPQGALSVAFRDVIFGYVADEPVLHNINFQLQAGKVLGVLGRTGSGKTTLARLLFRLYDPQMGEICLSGVSLREPYLHDLRRHIGMVTQDVQIFRASVRDNLTFFDRSIADTRIMEALEEVGLMEWYRTLPEGLDSKLESDGNGLSAGEAQLLAFTRVFLARPGLVILDEASSRLDPVTERLIERAISKLFENCTAIVIAHRLSTVQRADEILILQSGCILEHGSRELLASDVDSHFYHLLQTGLEEVHA
jgi:ABC-type multidrug transport system fused ATPase/permease subunit